MMIRRRIKVIGGTKRKEGRREGEKEGGLKDEWRKTTDDARVRKRKGDKGRCCVLKKSGRDSSDKRRSGGGSVGGRGGGRGAAGEETEENGNEGKGARTSAGGGGGEGKGGSREISKLMAEETVSSGPSLTPPPHPLQPPQEWRREDERT